MDTLSVDDEAVASNYEKDHGQLCRMTEEYIKTRKPNLLAVIYDQIDHTGQATTRRPTTRRSSVWTAT